MTLPFRLPNAAAASAAVALSMLACSVFDPDDSSDEPNFPATAEGVVAFTNVHVVPMDAERVLQNQTVVVRDDRIAALGPASEIDIPTDATVIDADGRYLMPGLADMHVHVSWFAELLLYVAHGVTTVRNMWGSPGYITLREDLESGERFGPKMYTAGPGIDGDPPFWPGTELVVDVGRADEVVAAHQAAGYDFIKLYTHLSLGVYDALVASAQARGIPYVGHIPIAVSVERALEVRQGSVEHFTQYQTRLGPGGSPVSSWSSSNMDLASMRALARSVRDAGVWSTPTLVAHTKFFSAAEEAAFLRSPELRYLPRGLIDGWRELAFNVDRIARDLAVANRLKMINALSDAGARLLVGSDAGFTYVIAGVTIHEELGLFVQAGLTPYQALRGATHDAAEFLGEQDEFGTVAEGLRADVILLNGNPLADIANLKRRSGVMLRWSWLSQPELERRLEEQTAALESTIARSVTAPGSDRVPSDH